MISARFGGPVVAVTGICEATAALGAESVIVATSLGQVPTAGDWRKVTPDEMPANAGRLDIRLFDVAPPRRLAFAPAMGRFLRAEVDGFDVVHIHSLWLYPQFAAQRSARRAKVPYVVSPRGALDPYLRQRGRARKAATNLIWQNAMLRHAARIHVTADAEAELIADVAPAVPRDVIPGGIWLDREEPGDAGRFRDRFLDRSAGDVVLFVGRISQKKGVDVLIRAFARARRSSPDAVLAIAGPDDEGLRPGLERLAEELGVARDVRFLGALYGQDKADALAAATVWALPSHSENFGNAVVEALAHGLPCVLSPQINIAAEIAEHDAAVVTPNQADGFGDALADLLADPARRSALAGRAREYARRYDWNTVGPRMLRMYEECIAAADRAESLGAAS